MQLENPSFDSKPAIKGNPVSEKEETKQGFALINSDLNCLDSSVADMEKLILSNVEALEQCNDMILESQGQLPDGQNQANFVSEDLEQ